MLNEQFQDLRILHPSAWPIVPRLLCGLGACLVVMLCSGFFYAKSDWQAQNIEARKEIELKDAYKTKLQQVTNMNLDGLHKQKTQAGLYVAVLENQLSGKAEMGALLSDINQAGVGRGLQFELFKPRQVSIKDYYAELPIDIKVVGTYHDMGGFASDIANLSRIVTFNNMQLSVGKDGLLVLDAVMKTFRYLDTDELMAQRKVDDVKKQRIVFVPTLVEPKNFIPFAYGGKTQLDPYNPAKFSTSFAKGQPRSGNLQVNSQPSQHMPSPKENVESYSLDEIKLVGVIQKSGVHYALLQADKSLFQVKVGDVVGKNRGVITRIGEHEMAIKEVIANAAGTLIERKAKLELQEKSQ